MRWFLLIAFTSIVACNTSESSEPLSNTIIVDTTSVLPETNISEQSTASKVDLQKLTTTKTVSVGPLTLKFGQFSLASQFTFDSNDDEYYLRRAERGNKFIISKVTISSEDKDPKLPCIHMFQYKDSQMTEVGTFDYRFNSWSSYGHYLGNYRDTKNDFRYSSSIRFNVGLEVDQALLKTPLIVAVRKINYIDRLEERFDNPPVSYPSYGCSLSSVPIDLNEFEIVHIFNKESIK